MPALARKPHDREHLACAIARHHEDLLRRARQLVGREEADDLVQSTVEKALRHLHAFQPDTNLLAWLRRIMSNLMIDEWRREKRRNVACLAEAEAEASAADQMPGGGPAAEAPWLQLSLDDVLRALPGLSRHVRPVFALHLEGLSYQEIADRLGLRTNTVGTRLLRARLQMRRLLTATLVTADSAPANDVTARASSAYARRGVRTSAQRAGLLPQSPARQPRPGATARRDQERLAMC